MNTIIISKDKLTLIALDKLNINKDKIAKTIKIIIQIK